MDKACHDERGENRIAGKDLRFKAWLGFIGFRVATACGMCKLREVWLGAVHEVWLGAFVILME